MLKMFLFCHHIALHVAVLHYIELCYTTWHCIVLHVAIVHTFQHTALQVTALPCRYLNLLGVTTADSTQTPLGTTCDTPTQYPDMDRASR